MLAGRSAAIALGLFALNFAWEMAQARFYSSMKGLLFWHATGLCARAAARRIGKQHGRRYGGGHHDPSGAGAGGTMTNRARTLVALRRSGVILWKLELN